MRPSLSLEVREASGVGAARRAAAELGRAQGLSDGRLSDLAIVVTELATNLVKHTPAGGTLLLSGTAPQRVEVLSLDTGPGIARLSEVLRDGYSTAGSAGTGLGAVARLADGFDLHAAPGAGCVVFAQLGEAGPAGGRPPAEPVDLGSVQRPLAGEAVCGDDWAYTVSPGQLRLTLIDGLGHGLPAHEAARAATEAFLLSPQLGPAEMLRRQHGALRATRGAVGAVASLDLAGQQLVFAGVGNISGALLTGATRRGLLSHNGTLGQETRTVQEQTLPWTPGSTLVLHSDGLSGQWDLTAVPGLLRRRAAVIAGYLYRGFSRERDDATVIVVKAAPPRTETP